jgi:hypothetical protein
LQITTPDVLPEAITGRPYGLAFAAAGASGPVSWRLEGELPPGLRFDGSRGAIEGKVQGRGSAARTVRVVATDAAARQVAKTVHLGVFDPSGPQLLALRVPRWVPVVSWRGWLESGFGFVVIVLVHMVAMQGLGVLEARASVVSAGPEQTTAGSNHLRRFGVYRMILRLTTLGSLAGLAGWMGWVGLRG